MDNEPQQPAQPYQPPAPSQPETTPQPPAVPVMEPAQVSVEPTPATPPSSFAQPVPAAPAPAPTATPFGQTSPIMTNEKPKVPIAAQILYALAFIGLIFGLLGAVLLFFATSQLGGPLGDLGRGIGILIAAIVIGGFYLVHEIRHGKQWALITYSVLLGLGILGTVTTINEPSSRSNVLGLIIVTPLILTLWLKNRNYFH